MLVLSFILNVKISSAIIKSDNQYTLCHISTANDTSYMLMSLLSIASFYFLFNMPAEGYKVFFIIIACAIFLPLSAYTLPKILFFKEKVLCDQKNNSKVKKK